MARQRRPDVLLAAVSLGLAGAAGAVLLWAPLGTRAVGGARGPAVVQHPSLVHVQGWRVAIPLAVPAAVAALAVAALPRFGRRAAWAGAALLAAWVVLGILSIGAFFAPSAMAMAMAAAAGGGGRRPTRAPA